MLKVFSVYDAKAEAFLQPFFAPTKGMAVRSFTDAAMQEDHNFARHAEDFTLFEIGEWDEAKGVLTNYEANQPLGMALEYINKEKV